MSIGLKSRLAGAARVDGLHDAVVLLRCRLIKRKVIVIQISESERELLYIVDQFAQRLVAAALYDEVVELLIESDDVFLVISLLDRLFILFCDLSERILLLIGDPLSGQLGYEAFHVLSYFEHVKHVLDRDVGNISAASWLYLYKSVVRESLDSLSYRCTANVHLLGKVDLHESCLGYDLSGKDLVLKLQVYQIL